MPGQGPCRRRLEPEEQARLAAAVESGDLSSLPAPLEEWQPYDLAQLAGRLSSSARRFLLASVAPAIAAETLEHLEPDEQYDALRSLEEPVAAGILEEMGSDAAADLVQALHPRQAENLLSLLPEEARRQVQGLLSYPESSAGGRMTVDFFAARAAWTAAQVIEQFRRVGRDVEVAHYVYVVDRDRRLVGVTSLRDVLLEDPRTPVSEFMHTQTVTVRALEDQESAAKTLSAYDFGALPVVDDRGRLVGVLSVDDVIDVLEEEATEDIQRLGGSEPLEQPYLTAGLWDLFRKRVGWLLILFVAAALTQNILAHYSGFLQEVIQLAFFIPLLIGTGGNAGSQAATLVIRAMAVGEVALSDFARVVWREARLGLLLGGAMALVTYVRALTFGGGTDLGLTVAATIAVIVLVTSTLGAGLPLLGRRLGFDPAVFSAPVITTVADAAGLLIYFQIARVVMGL